jgi:hypothetical protein
MNETNKNETNGKRGAKRRPPNPRVPKNRWSI